ncbi:hypothetical protein [Cohnella fermenti]|uniref:Uncharacterized protein n=1 Tax=Cohnella fermenti TaxID=2565925 RepID=A0A4S4C8U9_9BACL|nr:hypothetical protein [Cohnella fermenti]THF84100.1 hypothetical protein E6C55_01980 [Cohnella fermenti]
MNKKVIIGLLVFVCALGAATLFDYVRSLGIDIELSAQEPAVVHADPNVPVRLTLRVTKDGRPVSGHDITGLVVGAGNLRADKATTDADGQVSFEYFPYSYLKGIQEEGRVRIRFKDVSDSIFVAIQQPKDVELNVLKPEQATESKHNMNDIFGE